MSIILTWVSFENDQIPYDQAAEFNEDDQSFTIGRSNSNDFVVYDPENYASRKHATIMYFEDNWYIEDMSSVGTIINNEKELNNKESVPLLDGDIITIGDCDFRVSISHSNEVQYEEDEDLDEPNVVDKEEDIKSTDDLFSVLDNKGNSKNTDKTPTKKSKPVNIGGQNDGIRIVQSSEHTSNGQDSKEQQSYILDKQAVDAFYKALNLSSENLKDRNQIEVMKISALLLNTFVSEFRDMHKLRRLVVNEYNLNINLTNKDNPIQSSSSANQAIENLVKLKSDQKAKEYVEKSAKELKQYQHILLTSVTDAVLAAINHFDPQELENKLKSKSSLTSIMNTDGKLWKQLKNQFSNLSEEAFEESLNDVKTRLINVIQTKE